MQKKIIKIFSSFHNVYIVHTAQYYYTNTHTHTYINVKMEIFGTHVFLNYSFNYLDFFFKWKRAPWNRD